MSRDRDPLREPQDGVDAIASLDPGQVVDIPYANVYLANGVAIVPGGTSADEVAREQVATAFPDREIVQVPARALHEGGGGPHCITQQIPLK